MNLPQLKYLCLDPGTKRMGAAISDPMGFSVNPLPHVLGRGKADFLKGAAELVKAHSPAGVVVGVPINMDGTRGPMAQKAERFARDLSHMVEVPVLTMDERLSTCEAQDLLIMADKARKKRRQIIDSLAACIILKRFLEREKNRKEDQNENS